MRLCSSKQFGRSVDTTTHFQFTESTGRLQQSANNPVCHHRVRHGADNRCTDVGRAGLLQEIFRAVLS